MALNPQLDRALSYLELGWHVLPLGRCAKTPLARHVGHGWRDASNDADTVTRWFVASPEANVGVACQTSGLLAIDYDPRHGEDDLHLLEQDLGPLPVDTPRSLTGGGGLHILLRHPNVPLVGRLSPGVEVKSAGYIVVPPSTTKRSYQWEVDPEEASLSDVPARWLNRIARIKPAAFLTRSPKQRVQDGWLQCLEPRRYAFDLTGAVPNRSGFIRCVSPHHFDRSPSLKLYESADRGWYCFGCRRGGDIFDFIALYVGYTGPLTGTAFLRIQEALLRRYGRLLGVEL